MAPDMVILGAGSWGTALAVHLSRAGRSVVLWARNPALAAALEKDRVNAIYLPGHPLHPSARVTSDLGEALAQAEDVLVVVPSHHCRRIMTDCLPHLTGRMSFCSASKGIESDTLMTVSEVLMDVISGRPNGGVSALSGPSFALEVAAGHPTAVVVASRQPLLAVRMQQKLSAGGLRAYTNTDVVGVEVGGALKNVIAIGAGVVEGLGYGSNTRAALITRGLAEISRLAAALGGRSETLAGLAGLGDLVLTCTGSLSRNRALGLALGRGTSLPDHQSASPMVAEGVRTALSAHRLARREGVEMPIVEQVHALLYEGRPAAEAIRELLSRQLTREDR